MIVTPIEADDQTPTGLFLPETAKEKPQQGKVKEYLILKETDIPAIVENGRQ